MRGAVDYLSRVITRRYGSLRKEGPFSFRSSSSENVCRVQNLRITVRDSTDNDVAVLARRYFYRETTSETEARRALASASA